MPEKDNWPFEDPPNAAVVTLRRILHEGRPILRVFHDEEDGGWQFLDGEAVTMKEAMLVALRTIYAHDHTIAEVADLSPGWVATRAARGGPWTIERQDPSG